MKKHLLRIAASTVAALLTVVPAFADGRGSADFTRYVALGDSFGAGYSNDSLVISHQRYAYPTIIARQAGVADFQIPGISEPGIPPELQLVSLSPLTIARKSTTNGQPINLSLPRPYNNLSIPGARVGNLLTNTGAQQSANPFYQIILRGLGTAADQALALHPTFMTVWIGGNDVLGAILSGNPSALTPIEDFTRDYNALLDKLTAGAPTAGIVVGNVPPEILSLPFVTTVPPVVINPATNTPVIINGNPVFLLYETDGQGTPGSVPPGSRILLSAAPLLAQGIGIPKALAPQLPKSGIPLPESVVLTPTELAAIQQRAVAVNGVIHAAAAAKNIPVVDVAPMMRRLTSPAGINFAGVRLSAAFLTGGVFSYDGFHPTDIGYTLIANEFIKTINREYDTRIPQASIYEFFTDAPVDASWEAPDMSSLTFGPFIFDNIYKTFVDDSVITMPNPVTGERVSQ